LDANQTLNLKVLDHDQIGLQKKRPPFEELKMEVKSLGLEGVGRKYGVTGNSIKKWIKTYEKYGK
jgi:hypothetical protein